MKRKFHCDIILKKYKLLLIILINIPINFNYPLTSFVKKKICQTCFHLDQPTTSIILNVSYLAEHGEHMRQGRENFPKTIQSLFYRSVTAGSRSDLHNLVNDRSKRES